MPDKHPEHDRGDEDTAVIFAERVEERERMVREQLLARGIRNEAVLQAMRRVPRHAFIEPALQSQAYRDHPIQIGHGQTISQPYVVAWMSELLAPKHGDRVLEIGSGCGYQTAVLLEMGAEVHSVELIPELAEMGRRNLRRLGYPHSRMRTGDGNLGLPEEAPFTGILAAAAAPKTPSALLEQLSVGGRMVMPVGREAQVLRVFEKSSQEEIREEDVGAVRFVPLRG